VDIGDYEGKVDSCHILGIKLSELEAYGAHFSFPMD